MKTSSEKEKKLSLALSKLKNLNHENPGLAKDLESLENQKNQLEIEKKEIESKYGNLMDDYEVLRQKLDKINKNKENEKEKEIEFSDKIDELNQETDTLLEEIDKWQM